MQKAVMDRIFIKPDEVKKGAIIIEDNSETKTGVVVSVGEDVRSVKEGDHVIYFKWDDLPALDGLVAIREDYLLGLIEDE